MKKITYTLVNAEQRTQQFDNTFKIPPLRTRQNLQAGDLVKLIFLAADASNVSVDDVAGERMWVEITKITPQGFEGKLDNDPVQVKKLRAGDLVKFGPEHIIDIYED